MSLPSICSDTDIAMETTPTVLTHLQLSAYGTILSCVNTIYSTSKSNSNDNDNTMTDRESDNSPSNTTNCCITDKDVGHPIMRFVHDLDLIRFCGALNEACHAQECPVQFRTRFVSGTPDLYVWHTVTATANARQQFSIMLEKQEPDPSSAATTSSTSATTTTTSFCSSLCLPFQFAATVRRRICDAVQHGLLCLAEQLSYSLVLLVRLLEQHGLTLDAKSIRPELDRLFKILAWSGLVKQEDGLLRALVDRALDQCLQWWVEQVTRYHPDTIICDAVV